MRNKATFPISGTNVAYHLDSIGDLDWTILDPGSFISVTSTDIEPTDTFAQLNINNTHETDTLYLLLRDDDAASTPTIDSIPIPAGTRLEMPCNLLNGGRGVRAISLRSESTDITVQIIAILGRSFD